MSLLQVVENFYKRKVTEYFYDKFKKKLLDGEDLTEEELQKAIGKGFDINTKDNDGNTLCMYAARKGYTKTLLELVRLGADISIKDNNGKSLFDYIKDDETKEKVIRLRKEYEDAHEDAPKMLETFATRYFYDKFKKKLLDGEDLTKEELQKAINLGFDINATNKNGMTLCMYAAGNGKTETLKVLKELGANIDAQDKNGWTACMWAAIWDDAVVLFELVRSGADISIKSKARKTLFDYVVCDKTKGGVIKKEVIRLRKEYEEDHPNAPKMADELAKKYLPEVAVKLVNTPQNGEKAQEEGVSAAQKAVFQGLLNTKTT